MSYYDVNALKQYIVANAPKYGLDPATALKVWTGEGLRDGVWQSNIVKNGVREPSYGPFQFYMGGGMGNEFQRKTGLDPRDPKNVYQMADYAMAHAGKHGWGEWYAARDQGIGPWQGITKGVSSGTDGFKALAQATQPAAYSAGQFVDAFKYSLPRFGEQPGQYSAGQYVPGFTYENNPNGPTVVSAAGDPPKPGGPQAPTSIIGLLGQMMKETDPAKKHTLMGQLQDARFGIKKPSDAYLAQNLQDGGPGSLKYWFS